MKIIFCIVWLGISHTVLATTFDEAQVALSAYLKINTTNPPGNEMVSAQFLKSITDKEGLEGHIMDLGNGRANFYAVWKGKEAKSSIILLHHMDVVPAVSKDWKYPPFAGEKHDGKIYGRGATDIKGKGIIDLYALIELKRKNVQLNKDIVFLAVADEEVDSLGTTALLTSSSASFLKNAELLIDEGASCKLNDKGKRTHCEISVGEKGLLWVHIICKGPSGHAAIPIKQSSVNRILKIGNKINAFDFSRYAVPAQGKEKNTLSITILKTGEETINTIPQETTLGLDMRLAPGVTPDVIFKKLTHLVDDKDCRIEKKHESTTLLSSSTHPLFWALKKSLNKHGFPEIVKPIILDSATDSVSYRKIGIPSYGFEYYWFAKSDSNLAHGNDEFLSLENLQIGITTLVDILEELGKPTRLP